jgi:hypothetical protein
LRTDASPKNSPAETASVNIFIVKFSNGVTAEYSRYFTNDSPFFYKNPYHPEVKNEEEMVERFASFNSGGRFTFCRGGKSV